MRMDHMLEEALGRWVWVAVTVVDGCEAPPLPKSEVWWLSLHRVGLVLNERR